MLAVNKYASVIGSMGAKSVVTSGQRGKNAHPYGDPRQHHDRASGVTNMPGPVRPTPTQPMN